MKKNVLVRASDAEIITFFYKLFGNRVHEGMPPDAARKEAYDAVALRYGIAKGRLLNIISRQKSSQKVNEAEFRENALTLIRNLEIVNSGLEESRIKNEQLISYLKECVNEK